MRVVKQRPVAAQVDYSDFDAPATHRNQQRRAVGDGLSAGEPLNEELLDIPAFLRRQAD
jgi:hypothetical protein